MLALSRDNKKSDAAFELGKSQVHTDQTAGVAWDDDAGNSLHSSLKNKKNEKFSLYVYQVCLSLVVSYVPAKLSPECKSK